MALYGELKKRILEITHSKYGIKILDEIFSHPIFGFNDIAGQTGIPITTLKTHLKQLREAGILETIRDSKGQTGAVFAFKNLLKITEGRAIS